MTNRLGWLATIVVVAMFCNSKEAIPKPADTPPPNPLVITDPKPQPQPAPKVDVVLLDRLDAILSKLDLASLQTLVDKLESVDLSRIKGMIDLLNKYGEQAAAAEVKLSAAKLENDPIAQAGAAAVFDGSDENGCLCRKAGAKCHCTQGVWQKTLQKDSTVSSNPPINRPSPSPSSSSTATNGIPVRQVGNWLYWLVNGVEWHNGGTGVQEGQLYGNRFTYRGGVMLDNRASTLPMQPPDRPAQPRGYWKTECHGDYCTKKWVVLDN